MGQSVANSPYGTECGEQHIWDSVWLTALMGQCVAYCTFEKFFPETAYRVWGADSSEHMVRKT